MDIFDEYRRCVEFFIDYFWTTEVPARREGINKEIIAQLPHSWFTYRMKVTAAREARNIIVRIRKSRGRDAARPVFKKFSMSLSDYNAKLVSSKTSTEFDAWLHLHSIGKGETLDLPLKFHDHFLELAKEGKLLKLYTVTPYFVQFSFEFDKAPAELGGKALGIDSGLVAMATTHEGEKYGTDMMELVKNVARKRPGSLARRRASRALRQRIDEIVLEIFEKESPAIVVVEDLKGLNRRVTKLGRRPGSNMRRVVSVWPYRYWLNRLKRECEKRRSLFYSVDPRYTSQMCSQCSHTEKGNRSKTVFLCKSCGYAADADHNAAQNILARFLTGIYGTGCEEQA